LQKKKAAIVQASILHDLFEIRTLDSRLHKLARNYFESAILSKNPAIIELINNITFSSGRKSNPLEDIPEKREYTYT